MLWRYRPKENNRRRCELFLEFYEALVNIFERDIEPVRDVQAQLIERKGVKMGLQAK